jgi:HEAT repeat protein
LGFCRSHQVSDTFIAGIRFLKRTHISVWETILPIYSNKRPEATLDIKLLSIFFQQLNIFRKNVAAYPQQHPMIKASSEKAVSTLDRILQFHDEISVNIARDALFVGDVHLEPANPVLRNFAHSLFHRGVAAVTFKKGLQGEELHLFIEILSVNRELIRQKGVIEGVLSDTGIRHLGVEMIDYGSFCPIEENGLETFQKETTGAQTADSREIFSREFLKAIPNQSSERNTAGSKQTKGKAANTADDNSYVNSIKTGEICGDSFDFSITRHGGENIPPTFMQLLERLSKHRVSDGEKPPATTPANVTKNELNAFHTIFRKDNSERFVPTEYREKLHNIISSHRISEQRRHNIEEMKDTLSYHCIDNSMSLILVELFNSSPDKRQTEKLTSDLLDLCTYFLEMGEFSFLATLYDRLLTIKSCADTNPEYGSQKIATSLTEPAFLEEVLNGLGFWGKAKYHDIRTLIGKVGMPFAEPLLNRLADEPNISMRRYYMDCLMEMGGAARDAALARLEDNRWYFVRNVVILLRSMNDSAVLPYIRRLKKHPHAKVRREVLKTLIHFGDTDADRLLLRDMADKDKEVCLCAIKLAEESKNREVFKRLLGFLGGIGLTKSELEKKNAAIQTLAKIGNAEALPALARLFWSKNRLRPKMHNQLRQEIICSLSRYPVSSASKALRDIAQSPLRELAKLAAEILADLQDRTV